MGMHVDHGFLLRLSSNKLTAKFPVRDWFAYYRAIYSTRPQPSKHFSAPPTQYACRRLALE
jgi:hypothetical protein